MAGSAEKQEETAAEKAAEAAANGEPMADTAALAQNGDSVAATALAVDTTGINEDQLWKPVVKELQSMSGVNDIANMSIWFIFLMGIVGGLLALVMPCIWPIIPMTVSFFLKRAKDNRRRGIRDAVLYGVSIIVIFLLLGIGVTAIFGPSTLNALSKNAV